MLKTASMLIVTATALSAIVTPSFAQSFDRGNTGNDNGGNGGRGEYFSGAASAPITHVRAPGRILLLQRGGAYCATTWAALHDRAGKRNTIRHCDDRRHIDLD
ncbi:hypothetical protein [Rhizobium sp. SG2393]|uniref:hypothetical protein n=1 Tax=Rhizobium sp. SG2393 TaxID=3276279 RepID=UPI00366D5F6F